MLTNDSIQKIKNRCEIFTSSDYTETEYTMLSERAYRIDIPDLLDTISELEADETH